MSDTSRRKFLAAAGAGTAMGTIALAGGGAADAATAKHHNAAQEAVVAYVEDPHSNVVHLLVADREVVVKDRELVVRLLNAARKTGKN